ncbi:trehalose-phosphatase [Xanthobacter sp. AM11]|uniref:trehalose-phosphatase n=1 Tax=Xanthobacter sp. AM11 TaxID=3380643 RepID=UPI0039BFC9BC
MQERVTPSPVAPRADAALADIAQGPALLAAVAPPTHAFFLDVDGTLLDLAPHPDAVEVPAALPAALQALSVRAGGALALVSGRTVDRLDRLFAPLRLPVAGSHGAEIRAAPHGAVERAAPLDRDLVAALAQIARAHGGLFTEDKGPAFAIHYRARPELQRPLAAALAQLLAGREALALLPGHFVFEIKPAGRDKGSAIRALLAQPPFAGRIPVFIGDDVTDEAGFAAATQAGGLALAVGVPRAGAQAVLPGPAAVRDFLSRLAAEPQQHRR